ncbi:O-phosphoseryl-tRNA synthetase [archaeon BMS3Bbin15]|nr:O-phosphoseryl-tRNA synthetase [archaeon BMS3Bbin15]
MTRWKSKKIIKLAENDFERAWLDTASLIQEPSHVEDRYRGEYGKSNFLYETLYKLREAYLKLGFDEFVNPIFIEEKEVKRQFGPEALAVLDRCFYLAGLPRPDVGLSQEKLNLLEKHGIQADRNELQELLHRYKKGEVDGDDLIKELAETLKIEDSLATMIFSEIFPEFKELKPRPTNLTLRSHMTSGWFLTLSSMYGRKKLPIKLFSIDRCFRREQSEDTTHLRSHFSASCVVMAEDASVEDGKFVARELLRNFGFEKFKFIPDEKRSKYYTPGTQTEVYAYSQKAGWVEIATFGVYSPVALSRYKIEVPVMNLGLGVERLAMVLSSADDIREMVFPQFYKKWHLDDREIAEMIYFKLTPYTEEGIVMAEAIKSVAVEEAERETPAEITAFSGTFLGRKVEVKLVEEEEGKKLLGPAYRNKIFVKEGNILGSAEHPEHAFSTDISYLRACSLAISAKAEKLVETEETEKKLRFGMVKGLGDINLKLDEVARRYITTYEKKIDVRGPLFLTTVIKLK